MFRTRVAAGDTIARARGYPPALIFSQSGSSLQANSRAGRDLHRIVEFLTEQQALQRELNMLLFARILICVGLFRSRLKMLKRQLYGRAGIELLRARLLPEPAFSEP